MRLLQALSNMALDTSRNWASPPHKEECLPNIQSNPSLSSLEAITPCPITACPLVKSPSPALLQFPLNPCDRFLGQSPSLESVVLSLNKEFRREINTHKCQQMWMHTVLSAGALSPAPASEGNVPHPLSPQLLPSSCSSLAYTTSLVTNAQRNELLTENHVAFNKGRTTSSTQPHFSELLSCLI